MRHRYGRNHREREMAQSYFYKDVLPFSAMLAAECTTVVYKILFKEATLKGLSNYVFNAYSYAVSTLVLLPVVFIFSRRSELPTLELPLLYRIFLLGVIGVVSQICGYKGIEYSSPTLASAIGNLTPAFTFILAAVFRMENVALRSSSAQAKITGTVVSISGALVVVLYDGPTLIPASSRLLGSSQKNWVLGGLLLAVEYLLCSIWYIIQTQVMTIYPSETIVVFLYNLWGTIISAVVCLMAERSLSAWSLKPDISLVAILYSGVALSFITVVHTWGLHLKGPVYISIFRPFSIVIAAALSVTFLGEALYLGSVVGAILISVGFYGVMWGKAKEEEEKMSEEYGFGSFAPSSPLLERYNVEDK